MNAFTTDNFFLPDPPWEEVVLFEEKPSQTIPETGLGDFPCVIYNGKVIKKTNLLLINQLFKELDFPDRWKIEGVAEPSIRCKQNTKDIAIDFTAQYDLIPKSLHASIEEGMMLVYRHPRKDRSLKIEVYNDGEVAGIINDNKNVVLAVDVHEMKDYKKLVDGFKTDK